MDKLWWVLMPIVLTCVAVAVMAWRGRLPARPVLNAVFSLLLLVYLLITAGLGIFWVANQHLPVFDWHYVFGYALLLLVVVHLAFNLRALLVHLRRRPVAKVTVQPRGRRPLVGAFVIMGLAGVTGLAYLIGLRHGRTELRIEAGAGTGQRVAAAVAVVERFHDFSSHTRGGLLRRAPSADWGDPPPPFKLPLKGPRLDLPPARRHSLGMVAGLGAQSWADLLWHSAGISARSGGIHFRTSPSSGALFATELYLHARAMPGIPAGSWHYDAQRHTLQSLRVQPHEPDPATSSLPGIGALPAGSLGLLVATAVFGRSGHKYRDRAYRYVLCDLGHALENLRVVAQQLGLQGTLLQAFDEASIADALRMDETEEGVLAVMLLQAQAAPALPALQAAAWQPPALLGEPAEASGAQAQTHAATSLSITEAIHRATSLRAAVLPMAGYTPLPRSGNQQRAAHLQHGALLPLPNGPSLVTDALALIASRRSVRRYGTAPLALADLAALLAYMVQPGALLSAAVQIDVVASRVEGLAPGTWRYHPTAHALQAQRQDAAALSPRVQKASLDQQVIGDAAAVLVLSIQRAAIVADPAGAARGYRHAFIEAGLVGERVYLEAGARGLGVCAVGAFFDDELAALVGTDPAHEWVVHLAAVGVPG